MYLIISQPNLGMQWMRPDLWTYPHLWPYPLIHNLSQLLIYFYYSTWFFDMWPMQNLTCSIWHTYITYANLKCNFQNLVSCFLKEHSLPTNNICYLSTIVFDNSWLNKSSIHLLTYFGWQWLYALLISLWTLWAQYGSFSQIKYIAKYEQNQWYRKEK